MFYILINEVLEENITDPSLVDIFL